MGQQSTPVAVNRQLHVPGHGAAEIHGDIRRVGRLAGGLGKLEIAQCRPGGAVGGVLHRYIPGPHAEHRLEHLVEVPHQQSIQFIGVVKLVLNPRRLRSPISTEPHLRLLHRVLVLGIHARAVDGLPGLHVLTETRGRGCDVPQCIRIGLSGETPHRALDDGGIGRHIDLIHAPVMGPTEFEQAGRIERVRILTRAGQDPQRIRCSGRIDIGPAGSEVHIVRLGELPGGPAQDRVARCVFCTVSRRRPTCGEIRMTGHVLPRGADSNQIHFLRARIALTDAETEPDDSRHRVYVVARLGGGCVRRRFGHPDRRVHP